MRDTEATQERVAGAAEGLPGGEQAGGSYREKAKTVLRHEISVAETKCRRAGRRMSKLQALYDSLPENLSQEADEALWELLLDARRKLAG